MEVWIIKDLSIFLKQKQNKKHLNITYKIAVGVIFDSISQHLRSVCCEYGYMYFIKCQ